MSKFLVFSTVTDRDRRTVAFKQWISEDKDYRTALAYTGFSYDREIELEQATNYFFNTKETSNLKNFLTFYRYFKGHKKHEYDFYFLLDSNIFFPTYFLRDYLKLVKENKIDVSSPVHEKRQKNKFNIRKLIQKPAGKVFETDLCDERAVCLSKKAAKKLDSLTRKKIKFNKKTFNNLSFLAINFTPIKYV